MKLRKIIAVAGAMAVAGSLAVVQPAEAAQTGSTDATFTITAGTLDIAVPTGPVNLGSANAGAGLSQISGDLGSVSVSDNRGLLVAAWTASARTSAFTTGAAGVDETVPAASVAYAANAPSNSGGGVSAVFAHPGAAALSDTLDTTVATLAAGTGVNSSSWTANLTFTLLSTQVAGTYSGTVTHSVL